VFTIPRIAVDTVHAHVLLDGPLAALLAAIATTSGPVDAVIECHAPIAAPWRATGLGAFGVEIVSFNIISFSLEHSTAV
jgi:hypothetical protein